MLNLPTLIKSVDFKNDYTDFFIKKIMTTECINFVHYEDALQFLNDVIKNNTDCDDYFMEACSPDLGTQMVHYVHEKKLFDYEFIAPNAKY